MMKNKIDIAKEVYVKVYSGDPISNKELDTAIEVFEQVVDFLGHPHFYLAKKEINSKLMTLREFKFERENRW